MVHNVEHWYPVDNIRDYMKSPFSKTQQALVSENVRFAKRFVSEALPPILLEQLRELTRNLSLSLTGFGKMDSAT